jgi:hypothetical protein
MPKTLTTAIEDLRRDVARWQREIAVLEGHGHFQLSEQLRLWVEEARRIIGNSERPHA